MIMERLQGIPAAFLFFLIRHKNIGNMPFVFKLNMARGSGFYPLR